MSHPKRWSRADAVKRATEAWALRVEGATWSEIAKVCKFSSASTACRAVSRWMDGLPAVDLAAARELAAARGEALWALAWEAAQEGKPGALRDGVSVLARQSKLLGLDQPEELTIHTPTATEIANWVQGALAHQVPALEEGEIFPVLDVESVEPEPVDAE